MPSMFKYRFFTQNFIIRLVILTAYEAGYQLNLNKQFVPIVSFGNQITELQV